MVNNGYVSFIAEAGGGFDADRNPIAPAPTPSTYRNCNLKENRHVYIVVEDGQKLLVKYSIVVDLTEIEDIVFSNVNKISLRDADANDLGTFRIQSKQKLTTTNQLKILVGEIQI